MSSFAKKAENEKAEDWLLDIIEEFWRSMDVGDYEALLKSIYFYFYQ